MVVLIKVTSALAEIPQMIWTHVHQMVRVTNVVPEIMARKMTAKHRTQIIALAFHILLMMIHVQMALIQASGKTAEMTTALVA
jgi:hypothetical protein